MNLFGQNIIEDENGNAELNPFDYVGFYEANIAPNVEYDYEENKECSYEGKITQNFIDKLNHNINDIITGVFADKRLERLQVWLEKEGKQVCMFNMYILAMFIIEKAKNHYVFLLKPSPHEILETVKSMSKITFIDTSGSTVETTSTTLIEKIKDLLSKEQSQNMYEVDNIVSWDKIANKSLICCHFVHHLSVFMNKYFPTKRKKNALVSPKEVELILYMMKLMHLTNADLTNKRYWQLMNTYDKISKHICTKDYATFNFEGKSVKLPLHFIPYSVWHNGRLDLIERELPGFDGDVGSMVKF